MFIYDRNTRFDRAERKAKEVRPQVIVNSVGDYFVEGAELTYVVAITRTLNGLEIECNCLAGQNEKPCYHAAAAYLVHKRIATVAGYAATPARDKNLAGIKHDLGFIMRRADSLTSDFDAMDEIHMAVRSALRSLDEYEISLLPEVGEGRRVA